MNISPDMIASLRINVVVHGTENDGIGHTISEFELNICPGDDWRVYYLLQRELTLSQTRRHSGKSDDRYRYPEQMGMLTAIKSPSSFKLGDILSRIQLKQTEFQNKIDRKKKAEREWFDNKYQNGDKVRGNGAGKP